MFILVLIGGVLIIMMNNNKKGRRTMVSIIAIFIAFLMILSIIAPFLA